MSWLDQFAQSSGGGSLLSSGLNAVTSAISSRKQYKRQKELLNLQQQFQTSEREASQDWQKMMWDLANQYNSPMATMQRLKQAGLSPDLMYGQNGVSAMMSGSVPASTNGSAPSVPTPAGEASSMQSSAALGDAALRAAQIANLDSKTGLNKVLTTHEGEKIPLTRAQLDWTKEDINRLSSTIQVMGQSMDKVRIEIDNLTKEGKILDDRIKELSATFDERVLSYAYDNRARLAKIGIDEKTLEHLVPILRGQALDYMASAQLKSMQAKSEEDRDKILKEEFRLINLDRIEAWQEFQAKRNYGLSRGDASHVYNRAVELQQAMLEGNYALFMKQLENFHEFSTAQIWIDMITQCVGCIFSGASSVSSIKNTGADTNLKNFELKQRKMYPNRR